MDFTDEDADRLNEETFECAETGDWELDHEEFAVKQNYDEPVAPDANQLPRFWEASNDYSLLWSSEFPLSYENTVDDEFPERGVDVEDFLQKLVTDDAFEDPAILDISRKVAHQRLSGSALDNILGAPAYPSALNNILDQSRDIWRSNGTKSRATTPNDSLQPTKEDSLDLITFLKRTNESRNHKGDGTMAPVLRDSAMSLSANCNNLSIPSRHKGPITDDCLVNSQMAPSTNVLNNGTFMQSMSNLINSKLSHPIQNVSQRLPNTLNKLANSASAQYQKPFAFNLHPTSVPPPVQFFQNTPPPPPGLVSLLYHRPPPQPMLHALGSSTAAAAGSTYRWPPPMLSMPANQPRPPPSHYYLEMQRLASLGRPGHQLPAPQLFRPPPLPPSAVAGQLVRDAGGCLVTGAQEEEDEFDPSQGSWMSEYETVGVLMSYLRPLVVTNPYVEDYYFAVQWLRRLAAARHQPTTTGGVLPATPSLPPIAMSVPSPVTPDRLASPNYYHHTSMQQRFVIPLSQFTAAIIRHGNTAITSLVAGSASASLDTTAVVTRPNETQQDHQGLSTALGRPMRSNVFRPRVVVDFSPDALTNGECVDSGELVPETSAHQSSTADPVSSLFPVLSVKATRRRLLVLAWIERMFTLQLHISETELSLERIVVQNEMRSRLTQHLSGLVGEITRELLSSGGLLGPTPNATQPDSENEDPPGDEHLVSTLCLLLSVRKGARLLASLLPCLPPKLKHKCLRSLICGFTRIGHSCSSSLDELAPLLYPALRHCIYQEGNVNRLLADCFPTAYQSPLAGLSSASHRNAVCLLESSMGSSLIFCLLDTCARLSSPDDPSEFIRFGSYFTHLAATCISLSESADSSAIPPCPSDTARPAPLDSFTHLASILPLYLSMSPNPCVSADEVLAFCRRIDGQSSASVLAAALPSDKSAASTSVAALAVGRPLSSGDAGAGSLSATVEV